MKAYGEKKNFRLSYSRTGVIRQVLNFTYNIAIFALVYSQSTPSFLFISGNYFDLTAFYAGCKMFSYFSASSDESVSFFGHKR